MKIDMAMWQEIKKDPRDWHEYSDPGWTNRFFRLPNGIRISYCMLGPENGLPIFLCHGNTDSRISWSHVAPILANLGFRVYVPEQRGHGLSEGPVDPKGYYDFKDDLMEDVVALMDHLGVEKASFVGHSGGTFMLQYMAVCHPERVYSLSLISTASEFPYRKGYQWNGEDVLGTEEDLLALAEAGLNDMEFCAGIAKHLICSSFQNHIKAYCSLEFSHPKDFDSNEMLKSVKCPVQIFWGKQDPLFSQEDEDKLLAALTSAPVEFHAVDGGHSFFWDDWELLQYMFFAIATHARNAQKTN